MKTPLDGAPSLSKKITWSHDQKQWHNCFEHNARLFRHASNCCVRTEADWRKNFSQFLECCANLKDPQWLDGVATLQVVQMNENPIFRVTLMIFIARGVRGLAHAKRPPLGVTHTHSGTTALRALLCANVCYLVVTCCCDDFTGAAAAPRRLQTRMGNVGAGRRVCAAGDSGAAGAGEEGVQPAQGQSHFPAFARCAVDTPLLLQQVSRCMI